MTLLSIVVALLAAGPSVVDPSLSRSCPSTRGQEEFLWSMLGPSGAKEGPPPGGTAKDFLRAKDRWLDVCPHNEIVWYSILRATELTTQDRKAPMDLIEAARTAVPGSVWIETVRARALGTVEAAEAAIRLAPKHAPAQVALAAAYERVGDRDAALRVLRPIHDLPRLVGGPLLLARVALVLGDTKLAAESAHREPDGEGRLIEPVSSRLLVGEARVLEGDARLKLGEADKALSAFLEADLWQSADAMARLRSPTAELERAMKARLKKSGIPDDQRERLLEYLGAYRPKKQTPKPSDEPGHDK
jgi:tetratricopeptide (TPR) repeat protein